MTPSNETYWTLVESVWDEISIYEGEKVFLSQYEKAPAKSRLLFAAHWCQSEIRNGGLKQFFLNSTGILAPEAIDGFKAIQTPQLAAILTKASELFGKPYPRTKSARVRILSGSNKSELIACIDVWENEFFELLEIENGGFIHAADKFAMR